MAVEVQGEAVAMPIVNTALVQIAPPQKQVIVIEEREELPNRVQKVAVVAQADQVGNESPRANLEAPVEAKHTFKVRVPLMPMEKAA